jgi:hypothetical protein
MRESVQPTRRRPGLPGREYAPYLEATWGFKNHWEMIAALPGGATDPDNWIIQSCRRGWERVEARPHGDPPRMGGRMDGALIRRLGIPTARIGFPWPAPNTPEPYTQGMGGMGVACLPDLVKCAKAIMYAVIDTLGRTRTELGLR